MKLGELLIQKGIMSAKQLDSALTDQRAFGGKLGQTLVEIGAITETQLVDCLAEQLGLGTVDLDHAKIDPAAISVLRVDACERYGVFPLGIDRGTRTMTLATAEPDPAMLRELLQLTQFKPLPLLAPLSAIDRAVRRHYYGDVVAAPAADATRARPGAPAPAAAEPALSRPPPAAPNSSGPGQAAASGAPPATPVASDPSLSTALPSMSKADLVALVLRLEQSQRAQGRILRSLVELLQAKGIVGDGDLGGRGK